MVWFYGSVDGNSALSLVTLSAEGGEDSKQHIFFAFK